MNIQSIRTLMTEAEYEEALQAIRPYFENEPEEGTAAAAHFDALTLLIEHYEDKHYPMQHVSPVDLLKSVMAANQLTQEDLTDVIGSESDAISLLDGKSEFTLQQIRKISQAWHIPAGALID
jgi:HTH-type transcriptional regulator/antitoxin HigA